MTSAPAYTDEERRAYVANRCAKVFIVVMEPGHCPYIKRGSLFEPHGEIVMLKLLQETLGPEARFLVATVPDCGDDLWVASGDEVLSMFKHGAGRRAKRHVKEQLAKERAAPWHKPKTPEPTP